MAAVLTRAFPNWFLETKPERGWEEREKRKRRRKGKEEKEKGRSGASKQPPIMARV